MGKTALLLIDIQQGLLSEPASVYRGDEVVALAADLLRRARQNGIPVFHVRHDGGAGDDLAQGMPGWFHHPAVSPAAGEPVIEKTTPSAFVSGELDRRLKAAGIEKLVIAGLQTDYCIDTNCRVARNLGYDVVLAEDAHSTYDGSGLTAAQIIGHHNRILSSSTVQLRPADQIDF
ncbi:MAG: cysteine hydrolase family protein [Dongiaceae bacterium]